MRKKVRDLLPGDTIESAGEVGIIASLGEEPVDGVNLRWVRVQWKHKQPGDVSTENWDADHEVEVV